MADILNLFNSIPLINNVLWQYDNAPNLKSLIESKQSWYNANTDEFYRGIIDNFLNIITADDWGLALWGLVLQVPRTYNINGSNVTLERERYRLILRAKLLLTRMHGTVPEMLAYLNFLFESKGKIAVVDNLDMTITYRFGFNLSDLQLEILKVANLLPTPAGVRSIILTLDNKVFGFYGSGCLPFDQGRFASYINV